MTPAHFDLAQSAYQEMVRDGFKPDFPPAALEQAQTLQQQPPTADTSLRDLRALLWSSIDNDSSRDLDQIEYAEQTAAGIRVLVAIADVDARVPKGSPIDEHAASETTSVYTPGRVFPMLPEALSTDLTSLAPGEDRTAIVIEFIVKPDGTLGDSNIYQAVVRNGFQLAYESIGPWLADAGTAPKAVAGNAELNAQLKLQNEAAQKLRAKRHELGALVFDRVETETVVQNNQVESVTARKKNAAADLIEDIMVAANEVMARTLSNAGVSSIRRVVKSPERWPRIVQLAATHGAQLSDQPDSGALADFLADQKVKDPARYQDLSLGILKLMGPGEYVVLHPGEASEGHFGLAAHDYTHATAPNRRFADLVTQRLMKAVLAKSGTPYSDEELATVASNCTLKEDAARKVERTMNKRAAALAFANRIGEKFSGVVTGVTPKGVFARVFHPPIDGRVMQGTQGLDVGDCVEVTLLRTDPQQGFIDFAAREVACPVSVRPPAP